MLGMPLKEMPNLDRKQTKTVLVTGANGFIGKELVEKLLDTDYLVRGQVRSSPETLKSSERLAWYVTGDLSQQNDFSMVDGIDTVVHLAGRAHVMRETSEDPLAEFRRANVSATKLLATEAAKRGVRRFIFISSIGVNGNATYGHPFTENSLPAPHNSYAISKWEAELELMRISRETDIEVVILRPPLVYGPGAKANFQRLLHAVEQGWPLPFGAIQNRRSLLYLGNLVDAIQVCIEHPNAAGQTFLLADGEPVSTPELINALARALGRRARLLDVPLSILKLLGTLLGKQSSIVQLTSSLCVDSSAIRSRLGWTPPFSMEAGLAATVSSSG